MCSVDDSEEKFMVPTSSTRSNVCMKCGEAATVVIRMNDPFCRSCLIAYLVHKFRAAIGKSKLVRDGERVLVAVSGGPASTCLTTLIQQGLGENVHKKLRFKPSLIYVDEGAALGLSREERLGNWREMKSRIVRSGFPGYLTSLQVGGHGCNGETNEESASSDQSANQQTVFHEVSNQNSSDEHLIEQEKDKLKDLISSVKSLTEKENLIRILRYRLLLDIARQTGHTKVMCGDTASRLAVKLLSGIATGRGGHIPFDTGFADSRVPDVMVVRPLKDFTLKEVSMFNLYHDASPLVTPTPTTKMDAGSSIERLTETFVTGLQAGYLATVSNITRTGEKLAHIEGGEGHVTDRCALCQTPVDTDTGPSSALAALSFSQMRPHRVPLASAGTNEVTASHDASRLAGVDALSGLCYGCRITANDLVDVDKLPEAVKSDLFNRNNRDKMRVLIQDCLLSDDGT